MHASHRNHGLLACCGFVFFADFAAAASHVDAQERVNSVAATAGSGISLATGQSSTVGARTPLFLDVAYRTWNTEDPRLVLGASARVEFEGRASLAVVPRAELQTEIGPLSIRPGIAAPLFFAPFTLLGVEGSLTSRLALGDTVGLVLMLMVDAFVLGTDLPAGSVLLMFNGSAGVDIAF